jgi:hypothetical protein
MKRSLQLATISFLLILAFSACGPAMLQTEVSQVELDTPTAPPSETPTRFPTQTPLPSMTPLPTITVTAPETPLPTLDLPTLKAVEPALNVWDGLPTYLGDSQPGYYFRVKYDPEIWGLTQDSYGQPALGHRKIEYCILAPGGLAGMPPGIQVEHDTRQIGPLFFDFNVVLLQGVRQFVTYQAQTADRTIFTSFQVNFVNEIDACLVDAEAVLATLTSVQESQATPIP